MNSYAKLAVFIGVLLFSVSLMSVAINYLGDLSDVDFQVEIEQDMTAATKEPGEEIEANKERIKVKGVPLGMDSPLFEIWGAPMTQYLRWTVGETYEDGQWDRYEWREPVAYGGEILGTNVSLESSLDIVTYEVHPLFNLTTFAPVTLNALQINFDELIFRYPSLHIYSPIQAFITPYEVTYALYDFSINTVQSATISYDEDYQHVPNGLRSQLYPYASSLIEGIESPYERLKTLERHLRENFEYGADFEPVPEGIDPVEWFLFNQTKGTCAHFNSAFVLLARSLGLPVRVVAGFLMVPDLSYQRVMPNKGHMWAEAYFEGLGWITFDATPERYTEKPVGVNKIPTVTEIVYNPNSTLKDDYFSVYGTVRTQNGTDVSGLTVEIFLKVEKNETGVRVGVGVVEDGLYQITCKVKPDMQVGDYHLVAKTLPNELYSGSNSDPDIRVMTRTEVSIEAPSEAYVGEEITFSGTLLDSTNGEPVINETVSMMLDDEVLNLTSDGGGRVSVTHIFETEGERNVSLSMEETNYFLGSNTSFGVAVSMRLPPQPSLLQILTTFPYNIILMAAGATVLIGAVVVMSRKSGSPITLTRQEEAESVLEEIDEGPLVYENYKEGIVKLFNRFYRKNQRMYSEVTESMTPREFQDALLRRIQPNSTQALDYLVTAFEIADYSTSKPTKEMFDKCIRAVEILERSMVDE
jgi:transglutaminase-like putative cysteine protease